MIYFNADTPLVEVAKQEKYLVNIPFRFLSLSLSVLLLASFTFAQGTNRTATKPAKPTGTAAASANRPVKPAVTDATIESDLAEALAVIEDNYVSGSKLNYNDIFKSSIDGMLHSLDPHSNYFDSKEAEEFRTDQSSRYFGIGATIGDLTDEKGQIVATFKRATFENAPAHRAGLRFGDKIVEINGTSMLGKPFSEVRNFLRGPRGTQANIVVERYDTGKRETITLVRDAVPQPSISEAYMLRPSVGYIAISGGFNSTTAAEFTEAMRSLKAKGMKELVLDIKGNGGGLVREAYAVANTFLNRGQTIFTQKGRMDGTTEPFRANNPEPETMPVVVLVNGSSASASEILAGALQDHDRALIVGETTFGKGLVQNPYPLAYGSMLLLTIAKYETPSGRLIQRDYSNGDLYNYYTRGGSDSDDEPQKPAGPESKTDSGRTVYSGGGITPDVVVKADTIPVERARSQSKLLNPIFNFALDLAYGKVPGMEAYRISNPIRFNYDITKADFPVTPALIDAFKAYAVKKFGSSGALIDAERDFVGRALRSELVMAAYGTQTSLQVGNEYDNQLKKAVELMPKARELAGAAQRARTGTAAKINE